MIVPTWGYVPDMGVHFIAIGLDLQALAEFLAWWMPVNYILWLSLMLWVLLRRKNRLKPAAKTWWWHLLMTVGFLPTLWFAIVCVLFELAGEGLKAIAKSRREAKQRRDELEDWLKSSRTTDDLMENLYLDYVNKGHI